MIRLRLLMFVVVAATSVAAEPIPKWLDLGIGKTDFRKLLRCYPNDVYPKESLAKKLDGFLVHLKKKYPNEKIQITYDPALKKEIVRAGMQHDADIALTMMVGNVPIGESLRFFCNEYGLSYRLSKDSVHIFRPPKTRDRNAGKK